MTAEAACPRLPDGLAERAGFWRRSRRAWDVAFYALAATVVVSLLLAGLPRDRALAGAATVAVIALAYSVLARRATARGDARLALVYLVVLVALVTLAVAIDPLGSILLFVAYSQVWYLADRRLHALVLVGALTLTTTAVMVARALGTGQPLLEVVGPMAVALVSSLSLGLWISHLAEQGELRAALVEQLESTRAALAATSHAAGVLAERERLAQEIHDTLAQGFTSVVMLAQATAVDLGRADPDAAAARVEQIEHVARENLAEARALVAAFGPAGLQGSGLRDALVRLAGRFEAETGIAVEVEPGSGRPLPRDTEVVVLRAAQEALSNVRKHSSARRVRLRLAEGPDGVELEAVDDGSGLPPGMTEGVGLRGMRDRARAGGGTLTVTSAPAGGARLALRLPVARDVAADATGDGA